MPQNIGVMKIPKNTEYLYGSAIAAAYQAHFEIEEKRWIFVVLNIIRIFD